MEYLLYALVILSAVFAIVIVGIFVMAAFWPKHLTALFATFALLGSASVGSSNAGTGDEAHANRNEEEEANFALETDDFMAAISRYAVLAEEAELTKSWASSYVPPLASIRQGFANTPRHREYSNLSLSYSLDGREHQAIPELVDCSVFAPPEPVVGKEFLIQVFIHKKEELLAAVKEAIERDQNANRRGFESLTVFLTQLDELEIFVDCPKLVLASSLRTVIWKGSPVVAEFNAKVPRVAKLELISGTVHVGRNGIAIGEVGFDLVAKPADEVRASKPMGQSSVMGVVSNVQMADENTDASSADVALQGPIGTRARRYRSAFVSYSRADFDRVSLFAQGLAENDIELFVDVDAMEPGDDWQEKIETHIPRSDTFYLMWSSNAAQSDWVIRESKIAESSSSQSFDSRPRIKPVQLHRGAPTPPEFLSKYHFDSRWLAAREAQKNPLFAPIDQGS